MAWPWKERMAFPLETACDTDDLSPSSVQIIAKRSLWVVLLSVQPPKALWTHTQDG